MLKLVLTSIILLGFTTKVYLQSNKNYSCSIQLQHYVNQLPLLPNTSYSNISGETYTVTKLQYYISNIQLHNAANELVSTVPTTHYLINAYDTTTTQLTFAANNKQFSSITFTIGVDSVYNVSGAQTGALDPLNGMFWTWNNGYIMAKLEGTSPNSQQPNHTYTYHIGGFKTYENTVRKVKLTITPQKIKKHKPTIILINVQLSKWFDGVHQLKINDNSNTMSTGPKAVQFANNYATMFALNKIYTP